MTCADARERLSAFADDELDAWTSREVARHLTGCVACAGELATLRALSERVRADVPAYRAPDLLRARLQRELGAAGPAGAVRAAAAAPAIAPRVRRATPAWRPLAAAAAVVALVGVGYVGGRVSTGGQGAPQVAGGGAAAGLTAVAHEAVSAHVRSLMPGHLTDVESTDQHTVKPWFAGRVDFSPQVTDFAAQGYPLTGGRLDYLAGRPVAALVYTRRKHVVNVFEWPAAEEGGTRPGASASSERGYNVLAWTGGGASPLHYWLVSDLNPAELAGLLALLQDHARAGG